MIVSDVMLEDPLWVADTATVGEAVRRLDEHTVRHLPVLRDGVVVGILSDRDVRSFLPPPNELATDPTAMLGRLDTSVREVMTQGVDTVQPNRDLKDVVDIMLQHHIGAVVVVDPGTDKLVGIVSYVDVLRAIRDEVWG